MAILLVRDVDNELVQKLREQAAAHGRSMEAEHRAILESALGFSARPSFAEALLEIPDVGDDADFSRVDDIDETPQ